MRCLHGRFRLHLRLLRDQPCFSLQLGRAALYLGRRERTVTDRGHNLTQAFHADIARRIHPGKRGALARIGHNIALCVQLRLALQQRGIRLVARKHKHAERIPLGRTVLGDLAGLAVAVA